MKYIQSNTKQRKDNQWYSKKVFLDSEELNSPGTIVQEIKIKAWELVKSHHHKVQKEIFYFTTDHGYFIVNWETIKPNIWDVLVIEPNDHHVVVNESNQDYIYFCFKIDYSPEDFYRD